MSELSGQSSLGSSLVHRFVPTVPIERKMMKNTFIIALSFALSGCAHSVMRGTVAMKVDEHRGHVCLGENEVKVGDPLEVSWSDCSYGFSGSDRYCVKKKLGSAKVTRVMNSHYSEIETDKDVALEEGFIVEKL